MATRVTRASNGAPLSATIYDQNLLAGDGGSRSLYYYGAVSGAEVAALIQTALDDMKAGDFDCLVIPPGTWVLETSILSTGMRDGTGVLAHGATFQIKSGIGPGTVPVIRLQGDLTTTTTTLSADILEGATTGFLTSATGISDGDLIRIYSQESQGDWTWTGDYSLSPSETQMIRAMDGTKFWTDAPMLTDFTSAASTADSGDGVLYVEARTPARNIFWKGGTFDMQRGYVACIGFEGIVWLVVEDVTVIDPVRNGFNVEWCAYDTISRCNLDYPGQVTPDGIYSDGYTDFGGYGIKHAKTCYSTVINCTGRRGWHVFEAAHGTRDIHYIGCRAYSLTNAFNNHVGIGRITMSDCIVEGKTCVAGPCRYMEVNGGSYRGDQAFTGSSRAVKSYVIRGAFIESTNPASIRLIQSATSGANKYEDTARVEYHDCTFSGGVQARTAVPDVYIGDDGYAHVVVSNCTFINDAQPVIQANSTIRIHNVAKHGTNQVYHLTLLGRTGGTTKAFINGMLLTGSTAINGIINFRELELHVENLQDHHTGAGPLAIQVTALPVTAVLYLTNSTLQSGRIMSRVTANLIKDCRILSGTAFGAASNGGSIVAENGNWFADA